MLVRGHNICKHRLLYFLGAGYAYTHLSIPGDPTFPSIGRRIGSRKPSETNSQFALSLRILIYELHIPEQTLKYTCY
jgi:hypothetical protein